MNTLKTFLIAKPDFIRLLNSVFAVLVVFDLVTVSPDQFAVVVLAVEALFSYASKVAFQKDIKELAALTA